MLSFLYKLLVLGFLISMTSCMSSLLRGEQVNLSSTTRSIQNINDNWLYLENNVTSIQEALESDNWQPINLPHTWNQWDAVDNEPGYRRDASWYQRTLEVDDVDAQFVLYFEGANISSEIYLNGVKVGEHIGGYVGFEINISDQVIKNQENVLVVRVDNSYNPDVIPSQKADFFIYGGITRDVWLKTLPITHISKVKVSTPSVTKDHATTVLEVKLSNVDKVDGHLLTASIIDRETKQIVSVDSLSGKDLKSKEGWPLTVLNQPKLWSTAKPQLYDVVTRLWKDDNLIDEQVESIGYRWFYFEEYGAFYLNGERLLLRGTHRHEEHAGYGAAMPNALHLNDIEMIKGVGANFVRLGHYPQDPEIYKACNELGLIVWDELPWCRGGMGEESWQKNTENLLREQIEQNYNHPSIFFWSLGNEIYWLPDFDNGNDEQRLNQYLIGLNDIAHDLDAGRLTAIRKYYAGADIVDVFSPSIWSGWYAGVYTNYQKTLIENQKKYPQFLHMEYGGSSHVGRHTENPITGSGLLNEDDWAEVSNQVNVKNIAKGGDWTENYMVDLFDWYLNVTENKSDMPGNAQWAFKDFGTPLRPENSIPYLNQKGLVDRAGKPKDAYYVYKSYWSDVPFTYIESHSWTYRSGPEGLERELSVYSNCSKVELIHNGNSLGIKDKKQNAFPASGLTWKLLFEEGENSLTAIGYNDDKKIASDSMSVHYTYTEAEGADHIDVAYSVLSNGNYLIEATMRDKNNKRVLDYEKYIYFSMDGNGKLLQDYGTPTRSRVIEMANGYAAIELVPAEKGRAIIEARNQDFKGSYLVIDFDKNEIDSIK